MPTIVVTVSIQPFNSNVNYFNYYKSTRMKALRALPTIQLDFHSFDVYSQ